ncbi:MAG TPA: hypothetical protein VGF17_07110, partial [Phytomonospora sp.]
MPITSPPSDDSARPGTDSRAAATSHHGVVAVDPPLRGGPASDVVGLGRARALAFVAPALL